MRICAIGGCGEPHEAKGYCQRHYRSLKSYGDPLAVRRKRPSGPCELEGCDEPARRWGLCAAHSRALRTHGDPTVRIRRKRGTGTIRYDGYVSIGAKRHPLAGANGTVYLHRFVLFNAIGPGAHRCYWCQETVRWMIGGGPRGVGAEGALIVDHLDFDVSNNDRTNLVPSCNSCNAARLQAKVGN